MVDACFSYLVEGVIGKIQRRLENGSTISIGHCNLTRSGIGFQTQGIIFKKDRFVSWADVMTEFRNGQVVISSKSQSEVKTSVSMKDTENAVLLPILKIAMVK